MSQLGQDGWPQQFRGTLDAYSSTYLQ